MPRRAGNVWLAGVLAVFAMCVAADAAMIDLRITEIWMGGTAPSTEDWFELTNYGDMAWVSGVDPQLRVDDSSANFGNSQPIQGIASIAPGQSAIVLMEGGDGPEVAAYLAAWLVAKPQDPLLVGYAGVGGQGLGLGGGGDAVNVWMGPTLIDSEAYASVPGGQTWDVVLGAYSTVGNASGAVLNGATIGSPQSVPVPEPASMALLIFGLVGSAISGRRR